eukprot:3800073-Rhodomonas_salina.4
MPSTDLSYGPRLALCDARYRHVRCGVQYWHLGGSRTVYSTAVASEPESDAARPQPAGHVTRVDKSGMILR